MIKKMWNEIKTGCISDTKNMVIRCPKCQVIFEHEEIKSLSIIAQGNDMHIFECSNCNTHIPVKYSYSYNICKVV
jgi:uncharacterized protein (DUF2225 family)